MHENPEMEEYAMCEQNGESPSLESTQPEFTIGTMVRHSGFGNGRIVDYEDDKYVVFFKNGEIRHVGFTYGGMSEAETQGDAELFRMKQAMAELLGDFGWRDVDLEMSPKWSGGSLTLNPGRPGIQPKEIPLDTFFKKIIGVREKLRVLEQKINNHKSLTNEDKIELEGYITRCYGSLTSFNVLFDHKSSHFKGQSKRA